MRAVPWEVVPDGPQNATTRLLAGRYRLDRVLAVGGMATVWEGHDLVLSRAVAVKVPHPHLAVDPAYAGRFRREAVAAARLSHPGIVSTYDTGDDGGTPFIVMELVRGRTLRELLSGGPVAPSLAVAVVAQVAEALDVAHRAGLIHRDVKPANLLVVDEASSVPRIKVADFGVARAQDVLDRELTTGEATREGFVVGTARYLAPEQVAAKALDPRTDVYALGCVLHELLTGAPPFVRETDLGTALAHLQEPPPPLPPTVPVPLARIVADCLEKDPDRRPPSAADLVQRLAGVVGSTVGVPAVGPREAAGTATAVLDVPTAAIPAAIPPAAPVASPSPPAPRRPVRGTAPSARASRSRLPFAIVTGLVVAAVAVSAYVLVSTERPRRPAPPATGNRPAAARNVAIPVATVRSFDPEGDGSENDRDLDRLIDGKVDATWSTDRYRGPRFAGTKTGLGVILVLGGQARVSSVTVRSTTRRYAARAYVADRPHSTLGGWGEPLAARDGVDGDLVLRFPPASGTAVLVWFTDPGSSNRLTLSEISLEGPP